jgi:hypothetical protein
MTKIDAWAGLVSGSMTTLFARTPVIKVEGTESSSGNYNATEPLISSYATDQIIVLSVNVSVPGTSTLNINSLGTKSLQKYDILGNLVNLEEGDLRSDREYFFRYTGSVWAWISGTSSDQITVTGSPGFLTMISGSGNLCQSPILISDGKVFAGAIPDHSSSGSSFGIATSGSYGHIKIGDGLTSASGIVRVDTSEEIIVLSGSKVSHSESGVLEGNYYNPDITVDKYGHVTTIASGSNDNATMCGRLTLLSGCPVTIDDIVGSRLYYTPYGGNVVSVYEDSSWKRFTFSEIFVDLSGSQTGTIASGSTVVTDMLDSSQLAVGMIISGSGISGGTTIVSVDSDTQITLSGSATSTGNVSLSYALPADGISDIFIVSVSGSPSLRLGPLWSSGSSRSIGIDLFDGVGCLSGSQTFRHVGIVSSGSVAGLVCDSLGERHVSNVYNAVRKKLYGIMGSTATFTTTSNTFEVANSNVSNGQGRVSFVCPFDSTSVQMEWGCLSANIGAALNFSAIGLDSSSPQVKDSTFTSGANNEFARVFYDEHPGSGRHYLQRYVRTTTGTGTWLEDAATNKGTFSGAILV